MRPGVVLGVLIACGSALLGAGCASAPNAPGSGPGKRAARAMAPVAPAATGTQGPPDAGVEDGAPRWSAPASTVIEQEFIDHINRERTGRGLSPLVPDGRLTAAARGHSREMCELGYFDHWSPTAGWNMPVERFLRVLEEEGAAAPDNLLLGENIYHISVFDEVFDVAFGHRAIMASPSHRAAILEPRYTLVGVGVYQARGELWATEMFLRDTPWARDEGGP